MSFLAEPADTPELRAKYDADLASYGFVMNLMRVWGHVPAAHTAISELLGVLGEPFDMRTKGILVTATASTIEDSYCSLAWGWKLGDATDDRALAAAVLDGTDAGLSPREAALARWARRVASAAGATTQGEVDVLRDAGWSDEEIFRVTAFVATRMAFSTVNGALGARPDAELTGLAGPEVTEVVTRGRPVADL